MGTPKVCAQKGEVMRIINPNRRYKAKPLGERGKKKILPHSMKVSRRAKFWKAWKEKHKGTST